MKKKKDKLYIFLHMHKTGGTTMVEHIEKNFKPEEVLRLYPQEILKLYPKSKYKDNQAKNFFQQLGFARYNKYLKDYFESLSSERKSKIKVIYGHGVFYGIHNFFDKEARYIAFFRHPMSRTVSWYNYFRGLSKDANLAGLPALRKLVNQNLSINGKIPNFDSWIDKKYDTSLQMIEFLRIRKFLEKKSNYTLEDIQNALKKFYFVGLTETSEVDALYLYGIWRIKKFSPNINISKKRVLPEEIKKLKRKIIDKNMPDVKLYKCASEMNKRFKKENKNFYKVVNNVSFRRNLFLSFIFILEKFYQISAKLRKSSKSYSKALDLFKNQF
ncbi:hypothetical protein ACFLZZ_03295 [Nanoarchaeota archaeon]